MAAELCEGWLALFYSPHHDDMYREALIEGREELLAFKDIATLRYAGVEPPADRPAQLAAESADDAEHLGDRVGT